MARRWRLAASCSLRSILAASALGAIVLGLSITSGSVVAIGISLLVGMTLVVFALHGAWCAAGGLVAFADAVPGEANVHTRPGGQTALAWPALGLTVEGRSGVLKRPKLEGQASGEPFEGSPADAVDLAGEALGRLDVEADETRDAQAA